MQVCRLLAVLSVKGVTRGHLIGDRSSLSMADKLSSEDAAVLEACGWDPAEGIKRLLNFSGACLLILYCLPSHNLVYVIPFGVQPSRFRQMQADWWVWSTFFRGPSCAAGILKSRSVSRLRAHGPAFLTWPAVSGQVFYASWVGCDREQGKFVLAFSA